VYDGSSQVAGLHAGGDPCDVAGSSGQADAWRQAYTCTELLSTLIPNTPFMQHCLGPDDQYLPALPSDMLPVPAAAAAQDQVEVEASASCSYNMPISDETGTSVMAYDSGAMPPPNMPELAPVNDMN
jgi:MADS-box transcription enhancer factor 2B